MDKFMKEEFDKNLTDEQKAKRDEIEKEYERICAVRNDIFEKIEQRNKIVRADVERTKAAIRAIFPAPGSKTANARRNFNYMSHFKKIYFKEHGDKQVSQKIVDPEIERLFQ